MQVTRAHPKSGRSTPKIPCARLPSPGRIQQQTVETVNSVTDLPPQREDWVLTATPLVTVTTEPWPASTQRAE